MYATLILSFIISFVVFSICQHQVISILTTPESLNTKNIIRYSLTNTCLSCCPKHRSIQISSFVMYCSKYYLIFEKNFSHLFIIFLRHKDIWVHWHFYRFTLINFSIHFSFYGVHFLAISLSIKCNSLSGDSTKPCLVWSKLLKSILLMLDPFFQYQYCDIYSIFLFISLSICISPISTND